MEEEMEGRSLLTISIPKAELNWYKKNKEVIVDGKLFDVKDSYQDGELIFLIGLFDADETDLKNKIQLLSNADEDEKANSELAHQYFSIQLFHFANTIDLPRSYILIKSSFPKQVSTPLTSLSYSVITPPPEA